MSRPVAILIFIILAVLVIWYLYRTAKSSAKRALSGERSLDDKDIWLRSAKPLPARVLSKKETVKPEATGIAKVELELEIQVPESNPIRVNTTWLVEIASLPQLEAGNTVEVKIDPKKPKRVFPAVSWARLWVFGK